MTHVVVSGVPGSGKSTLAAPLARALRLPLLSKDPVKEALWDRLGGDDLETAQRFGWAANEVILTAAASAPHGSVLESFWHPEWATGRLRSLPGEVVEVFCDCPVPEARRRLGDRRRHSAHPDAERLDDPTLWGGDGALPLFDGTLPLFDGTLPLFDGALSADTTAPVDVDALARDVRSHPRWNGAAAATGAPALIVVTGLPGTGKTTIAAALSTATGAPIFGRDVVGAALCRTGVTPSGDPDGVAFDLLGVLAGEQLNVGAPAILDSVGGRDATREQWRALAGAHGVPLIVIECVCSDEDVHRRRLEGRTRGIPGWYELNWSAVEEARGRYQPWPEVSLVLDAVNPNGANVAVALAAVEAAFGAEKSS